MASELTAAVLAELRKSVGAVSVRLQTLMFAKHLKGDGGGIMQHLGDDRVRCVCVIDDAALGKALVELWTHAPALIAAAERADAAERKVGELEEALEKIDNGRNATQVKANEIERLLMPDHLVTPDGFIDMPPATKRGIMWAADIARTALGKEPRPTIYPPKSMCICGHCYPAPAGSLCNPAYHKKEEPRP